MKTEYTAAATAHGGRSGHVRSSDGILDFDLKRPKEMGGPGGGDQSRTALRGGLFRLFRERLPLHRRQAN